MNVVAIEFELEPPQQVKPSARNTDAMSTNARFVHTDPHVTARQPKGYGCGAATGSSLLDSLIQGAELFRKLFKFS